MGRTAQGHWHCQPVLSPYSVATAPAVLHEGNIQIRPLTTPSGRSAPANQVETRKSAPTAKVRKVGLGAFGGDDDDDLRIERIVKKVSPPAEQKKANSKGGQVHTWFTQRRMREAGHERPLGLHRSDPNRRPTAVLEREDYEERVTQQKASADILRKEKELRAQQVDEEADSDDDGGLEDEELLVTSLGRTLRLPVASLAPVKAEGTFLAHFDIPFKVPTLNVYQIEETAPVVADDLMLVEGAGEPSLTETSPSRPLQLQLEAPRDPQLDRSAGVERGHGRRLGSSSGRSTRCRLAEVDHDPSPSDD